MQLTLDHHRYMIDGDLFLSKESCAFLVMRGGVLFLSREICTFLGVSSEIHLPATGIALKRGSRLHFVRYPVDIVHIQSLEIGIAY